MRINSLIITPYKNIDLRKGIKFDASLITLLIGQNGVGKSNLLEVLAQIFSYLYAYALNYKKVETPSFEFIIEYECRGKVIQAALRKGQVSIFRKDNDKMLPVMKSDFIVNYSEYLPSQVFVYYSGENRRIEELYSSLIDSEYSKRRSIYRRGEPVTEPVHVTTLNNFHGSLILLTLLLYKGHEEYKNDIESLFKDVLHINIDSGVELSIQSPDYADIKRLKKENKLLGTYIDSSTGLVGYQRRDSIFWGLQGNINDFLRELLEYVQYTSSPYKHGIYKDGRKEREKLDFKQIEITQELAQRLYQHFESPLDFFNMLNEMSMLGMIENINFSITKNNIQESLFPFNQLSEGEQQFLTVMGMIALNKGCQSELLFLLDEPDTHINPIWQREYISTLVKIIGGDDKDKLSFFISTHSPFLVQSYNEKETSMFLFSTDNNGNIEIKKSNEIIKNWSIDQVLLSKYFNFKSTRPSSFDDFVDKRNKIVEKGEVNEKDIEYLQTVNQDMGFLPTGESLNDIKVMAAIHKMYQELKQQKE